MRIFFYLFTVLVSLNSCSNKTISQMENQNGHDESSLTFSSKDDVLKWGRNKYGFSFSGKFDDLMLKGKYFIFYAYHGHGIIYTDIYIFSQNSIIDKLWKIEIKRVKKLCPLFLF
ncbi:MAG: hypothetical protein IPK35_12535 [Saprospiraceae bacterium]|nr:hypothetical protein [Saprospiraceae bacterium]